MDIIQAYGSDTASDSDDGGGECSPLPLPPPNTEPTTQSRSAGSKRPYSFFARVEVAQSTQSAEALRLKSMELLDAHAVKNGCHKFSKGGQPVPRADHSCRAEFKQVLQLDVCRNPDYCISILAGAVANNAR